MLMSTLSTVPGCRSGRLCLLAYTISYCFFFFIIICFFLIIASPGILLLPSQYHGFLQSRVSLLSCHAQVSLFFFVAVLVIIGYCIFLVTTRFVVLHAYIATPNVVLSRYGFLQCSPVTRSTSRLCKAILAFV